MPYKIINRVYRYQVTESLFPTRTEAWAQIKKWQRSLDREGIMSGWVQTDIDNMIVRSA